MKWLLILCACHTNPTEAPDGSTIDGNPCQATPPPTPAYCVTNGLAAIALAGAWTMTGTVAGGPSGMGGATFTVTLSQTGTGWCAFGFATSGAVPDTTGTQGYVDTTHAYFSGGDETEADPDVSLDICAKADGTVSFAENWSYYMDTLNNITWSGTLTQ